MRRVRIGFVVLAIVLLAPLGLLLSRTLDGLERERDERQGAVASRVFDEAERQLGGFLRDEEARPAGQYRHRLASGALSPLAAAPAHDFVIGYFEVDAAGAVASPRGGASETLLSELRAILPAPSTTAEREEAPREQRELEKAEAREAQGPGTTRMIQKLGVTGRAEAVAEDLEPPASAAKRSLTSYGVLERLNRATRSRGGESVHATKREGTLDDREAPRDRATAAAEASGRAPGSAPVAPALAAGAGARKPESAVAGDEAARSEAPSARPDAARAAASPSPAAAPRRVHTLDLGPSPLTGALVTPERLVLYRTAALPGEAGPFRQGLVVDVPRLGSWLRTEVLGRRGLLDSLVLEFRATDTGGSPWRDAAAPADRFVYEHRFGEPFDAISARLLLPPLPDEGGARYVYWMGLLLVVASTVGLFAVYRRVAVAVEFAERRSNFAAAVSHELKTPLTAIRMYAEMLRDGMVDDEAKRQEYYRTLTSESERLSRLIDNVLEFSKLENDRRELSRVTGSIEAPLREVVRVLAPHAAAQGFTLTLEIEPGLPAVAHDPDALRQILFNLVDNALKYARDAERREVAVTAAASGAGVLVRVRDHGPGVAPAHLPHVFEAFYRGQDELTRRTQGTGIGLALVRGLVEQMKGSVVARNHPEGGLELELRLGA